MKDRFSLIPKKIIRKLIMLALDDKITTGAKINSIFTFLLLFRWSLNGICTKYSITALAKDAKVSRPTLMQSLNILREKDFLSYSSMKGGRTQYLINDHIEHEITKIPYRFSSRSIIEKLQSKDKNKLFAMVVYLIFTLYYDKNHLWFAICGFSKIIEITNKDNSSNEIATAIKLLIDYNLIRKQSGAVYEIFTNEIDTKKDHF